MQPQSDGLVEQFNHPAGSWLPNTSGTGTATCPWSCAHNG